MLDVAILDHYSSLMDLTSIVMLFTSNTITFKLPGGLLSSVCYVESKHNPKAYHQDDGTTASVGICQVKLGTARLLGFKGTESQLMAPPVNVYYSAKYLKKQLVRYKFDIQKAVAAYNSGTYRPDPNGVAKNFKYVKKVFLAWQQNPQ